MRGKTVKSQGNLLRWVAYTEFLGAGYHVSRYITTHQWQYLVVMMFLSIAGVFLLVVHWLINHPRIPKWAEESFRHPPQYEVFKGRHSDFIYAADVRKRAEELRDFSALKIEAAKKDTESGDNTQDGGR